MPSYLIKNIVYEMKVDTGSSMGWQESHTIQASTIDDLVRRLCGVLCIDPPEEICITEHGSICINYLANENNCPANEDELAEWKAERLELYPVEIFARVWIIADDNLQDLATEEGVKFQ